MVVNFKPNIVTKYFSVKAVNMVKKSVTVTEIMTFF